MKPILFNTEIVQAILEGRKSETRRAVKLLTNDPDEWEADNDVRGRVAKEYGEKYAAAAECTLRAKWAEVWDSTIVPADRALYGWSANPWVWVYEFKRIDKSEAIG